METVIFVWVLLLLSSDGKAPKLQRKKEKFCIIGLGVLVMVWTAVGKGSEEARRGKGVRDRDIIEFYTVRSFLVASKCALMFSNITTHLYLDFLWKRTIFGLTGY